VNSIDKACFLATTNYPERLGARIINRPSRFDKRFKIGYPKEASRRMYLEFLIGGEEKVRSLGIDLDMWVRDTEGFSLAHLKELFTAVVILDDSYEDAIRTLRSMRETPDSYDDEYRRPMGLIGERWSESNGNEEQG
jgi:SpoVK/Ycf46/Vps4 family AAA+-type ATPase